MRRRDARGVARARRRRWRSGRTTLAASASPPAMHADEQRDQHHDAERRGRRVAKPRSSSAGCGLSAPTTMPAARQAKAISSRIRRIIRLCGSFAGVSSRCRRSQPKRRGAESGVGFDGHHAADAFAQFLARLEVRNVLARERDGIAGLRVAAQARRTVMQREAAETADFDAFAAGQRRRPSSRARTSPRDRRRRAFRWPWRAERISISSDLVMRARRSQAGLLERAARPG